MNIIIRFYKNPLIIYITVFSLILFTVFMIMKNTRYGGDFQLSLNEESWTFSHNAPDISLLYFGYSQCSDICPMTLTYSSKALARLNKDELNRVRFLFVSVNYPHETSKEIHEYSLNFHQKIMGLAGTQKQINTAAILFKAPYSIKKTTDTYLGYSVLHTDKVFILNKEGIVLDGIISPKNADEILSNLRRFL